MNMTTADFNNTNGSFFDQSAYFYSEDIRIFYMFGASLCFLVSILTIVVNTLYIVCLYVNRRQEWFSHSKNILSIVVIDLTVGITSLWMTLTASLSNVPFYICALSQSLCLSAQVTTSLSILRLCVVRIITVRQTVRTRESSSRSILLQTFILYSMSSILCFSPVFIWAKYSARLKTCMWSELFRDNTLIVDKFMLAVLLVPTLLTTSCYIFLSIYLKKKQAAIFPSTQTQNKQNSAWTTAISKSTTVSRYGGTTLTDVSGTRTMHEATSSYEPHTRLTVGDMTVTEQVSNNLSRPIHAGRVKLTYVAARDQRLSNVVRMIGAILVCSNASVLPYVILLAIKIVFWPMSINPFFWFLTSFFLMLNSIADPLIYAVNLKHLRAAFKKLLSNCVPCVRR